MLGICYHCCQVTLGSQLLQLSLVKFFVQRNDYADASYYCQVGFCPLVAVSSHNPDVLAFQAQFEKGCSKGVNVFQHLPVGNVSVGLVVVEFLHEKGSVPVFGCSLLEHLLNVCYCISPAVQNAGIRVFVKALHEGFHLRHFSCLCRQVFSGLILRVSELVPHKKSLLGIRFST